MSTATHIVIDHLYIHDVNGTNEKKDNGGIIFSTNGPATPSRFGSSAPLPSSSPRRAGGR